MDKSKRFKAGLRFGIGMAVFYIMQKLLKNDHQTSKEIAILVVSGITGGAISGLLFGWLISLFIKSKIVEFDKVEMEADEKLLFESTANHFKGIKAIGGKLYLTNKRLIFNSYKSNTENPAFTIGLIDINSFNRYKILGVVNHGLSIITNHETMEKFEVVQIEDWIRQLTQRKNIR